MNEQIAMNMLGGVSGPSPSPKKSGGPDSRSQVQALQQQKMQIQKEIDGLKQNKKIDPKKAKEKIKQLKEQIANINQQIQRLKTQSQSTSLAEEVEKAQAPEGEEEAQETSDAESAKKAEKASGEAAVSNEDTSSQTPITQKRFDEYISTKDAAPEMDNIYQVEKTKDGYEVRFNRSPQLEEQQEEKEKELVNGTL